MGLSKTSKALGIAAATLVASTPAAFAQQVDGWGRWWWRWWGSGGGSGSGGSGGSNAVPEIDASAGLLAVAAVLATLALAWELRRRRQKNTQ